MAPWSDWKVAKALGWIFGMGVSALLFLVALGVSGNLLGGMFKDSLDLPIPMAESDKPTRCFDRTYGSIPGDSYIECPHREHKLDGKHCICQRVKEKWIYTPVHLRCHWDRGVKIPRQADALIVQRPDGGGIIVKCP